jgi:Sortilin, neurotensin receptor 3,
MLQEQGAVGTLFVDNSEGTFFVESLKSTNCNEFGFVDYKNLYGIGGVGLVNVVANAEEVEGRSVAKQLRTHITFDDGESCLCVSLGPRLIRARAHRELLEIVVGDGVLTVTPQMQSSARCTLVFSKESLQYL